MLSPLSPGLEPVPGYTLVRSLGRGGFGEVWEACAPGGVRVALKFIRLEGPQSGPERRALEAIRDIRHPHLLDVQFAAAVGDHLVIGMPLCEKSLKDRLDECLKAGMPGVPREELQDYLRDVARAVDYLNEARHPVGEGGRLVGVQHRDIKPHNIFLVGGSARLADFGLAKILEGSIAEHTGGMSPLYVAPEMIQGKVSSRTDQYSLAVAYAQLRTGRLPFGPGSVHQILFAHIQQAPDLSGLPPGEREAVARALAKSPEERWPDCRTFVRELERGERTEPASDAATRAFFEFATIPPTTVADKAPDARPPLPRAARTEPCTPMARATPTARTFPSLPTAPARRRIPRLLTSGALGTARAVWGTYLAILLLFLPILIPILAIVVARALTPAPGPGPKEAAAIANPPIPRADGISPGQNSGPIPEGPEAIRRGRPARSSGGMLGRQGRPRIDSDPGPDATAPPAPSGRRDALP